MAWWNDFVAWFNSAAGSRVFLSVILPFVAIVVAGVIAAVIGRGSVRRVIAHQDREFQGAAIVALIVVGRKASIWSSLGADEKQHIDSLMSEADIRVRLLPVSGAGTAADWAAHQLADMKKNSASFSFQAEQTFFEYRDRLLDWQIKPGRARKLFASDLQQWQYEDQSPASAPSQEWTPAPVTPSADSAATRVLPTAPELSTAPSTTPEVLSAPPTTPAFSTALPTTPGLSTAPPPTATAASAPPPFGVGSPSSPPEPADDPVEETSDETSDEEQTDEVRA